MIDPIAIKPEHAGALIEVGESELNKLLRKNPELQAAIVRIPGLRGKRIHVARFRSLIDKIAEEQGGQIA